MNNKKDIAFPVLIDNIDGNTLFQALNTSLKEQANETCYNELCIATAFFTLGWFKFRIWLT